MSISSPNATNNEEKNDDINNDAESLTRDSLFSVKLEGRPKLDINCVSTKSIIINSTTTRNIIINNLSFGHTNPEKTVKIQTPEATQDDAFPDYSDEDLDKLVKYFQGLTTLYDLQSSDWTETAIETIKSYILDPNEILLTIFFDGSVLTCLIGIPRQTCYDLTYFFREHQHIFDVQTFHDHITFGTIDDNFDGTILNVIENIYAPVIFRADNWPDSILHPALRSSISITDWILSRE